MEKKIIELLKDFKNLAPRPEFLHFSKLEIAKHSQLIPAKRFGFGLFNELKTAVALALGALLIIMALVSPSFYKASAPQLAESIQGSDLLAEAGDFKIQIAELEYYTQNNEDVLVALVQISDGTDLRNP